MSLDTHIDYKLEYSTEIETSTLYQWCIREFYDDGKQIGRDLIPWRFGLKFRAEQISYQCSIDCDRTNIFEDMDLESVDDDADNEEKQPTFSEVISAKLKPFEDNTYPPRYRMMGCSRNVEDIWVSLYKSEKDFGASCWVMPSYEGGIDFHERTEPDHIGFFINLDAEMFDEIAMLLKRDTIGDVMFYFSRVDGFYSDWSPDIFTSVVKVLGSLSDHNLDVTDELKASIPTAGEVGEFQITTGTKNFSRQSTYDIEDDLEYDIEEDFEDENFLTDTNEPEKPVAQDESGRRVETLVRSLRLPLWLSFIALMAIAFQMNG